MAIRYYCDGCDKQLFDDIVRKISVSVKKNGEVSAAGGAYELCDGCADHLVRDSNPHNWTRCEPQIKRTA